MLPAAAAVAAAGEFRAVMLLMYERMRRSRTLQKSSASLPVDFMAVNVSGELYPQHT